MKAAIALLISALIILIVEQVSLAFHNGWWMDEIATLVFTDPSQNFAQAYGRFGSDPSPPAYYVAIYSLRRLISLPEGSERTYAYVLSLLCFLLTAFSVLAASRKAGLTSFALTGIAAFILSGAVVTYLPEARTYFMGMCIVFAASWFTALAIEEQAKQLHWRYFAVVGCIAALTHLFAALMCGALAAGLITLAFFGKRRDLWLPGVAMGLSTSALYGTWYLLFVNHATWQSFSWLTFTLQGVIDTQYSVRHVVVGGPVATAILLALLPLAVLHRPTRPLAIAFTVAFALFVILPILISFKVPIICNRYFLIGAPAFVTFMVFLARATLGEVPALHKVPSLVFTAAVILLAYPDAIAYRNALERTENKAIWRGAELVAPLIRSCPEASIHVPAYVLSYAQITHEQPTKFIAVDALEATSADPQAPCPVLGWSEHLYAYGDFMGRATNEELLRLLRINMPYTDVSVRRFKTGYVVLRKDAATSQ